MRLKYALLMTIGLLVLIRESEGKPENSVLDV